MASTLLELRRNVLVLVNDTGDLPSATGERFKTPSLNIILNRVIKYYVRLINIYYQGYLNDTIPISLIANQREYALGSGFRSPIYEVRRTINQVDYFLDALQPYEFNLSTVPVPNNGYLPNYWLEGNNIVFSSYPSNNEANAIFVKYQKMLPDLVSDSDELDDQLVDAEECIITRSAIWALKSKDVSGAIKNITGFEKELVDLEKSFMVQVGSRYVKPSRPIPTSIESSAWY